MVIVVMRKFINFDGFLLGYNSALQRARQVLCKFGNGFS